MKLSFYRLYLILSALEGILCFGLTLRAALAEGQSLSGGFAPSHLVNLGVILTLTLVFIILSFLACLHHPWILRMASWIDDRFGQKERLLPALILLATAVLIGAAWIALWVASPIREYRWYASIFKQSLHTYEVLLVILQRVFPLLVWSEALLLQTLLLFVAVFFKRVRSRQFWDMALLSRSVLIVAMLATSGLQWLALALRIPFSKLIPGWYWSVNPRPLTSHHLFFLLLLALSVGVLAFILRQPQHSVLCLLMIVALGYIFQIGFGLIQGGGYEYFRLKYADSKHRSYALIATGESPGVLDAIRHCEERYGSKMFPGTKPPGVVALYIMLERGVNLLQPKPSAEGRFLTLTRALAYIFPLLASLASVLIYFLVRQWIGREAALIPALLFILAPNVILIPMFLDQALYPSLFLTGLLLMWWTLRRRAFWPAILTGIYIYAAIFFTFSMLTLLPLFFIMLALDYLFNRSNYRISHYVGLALGVSAGVLILFILTQQLLNYDFFQRYATAMRIVRNFDFVIRTGQKATVDLTTTTVQPTFRQILRAAGLNNLELACAAGFPISLLFIWRLARTLANLIRRRVTQLELGLGSLGLTYIALNLYGQVQGEVSRLWIFWVTMLAIFAGVELTTQFKQQKWVFYLVVLLQLFTALLIFQFQDFIV